MNTFIRKVEEYIDQYELLPEKQLVVGVSGGADSMALLYVLHTLRLQKHLPEELLAVHVHHGIRGESADKDEELVRNYTARLNVPLEVVHVDIPKLSSESGRSLETEGRIQRYRIFEELKKDGGLIATAHHKDDSAESVAMHIFRGCGMEGLNGIRPKTSDLIRPFLCVRKAEILAFCEQEHIPYREDETNGDSAFGRNFFRNEVFPKIDRGIQMSPVEALDGLSRRVRAENDYLDELASEELSKMDKTGDPLLLSDLLKAPAALRRRILRIYAAEIFGDVIDITEAHWEQMMVLLEKNEGSKSLDLPNQRRFLIEQGRIRFLLSGKEPENGGFIENVGFITSEKDKDLAIRLSDLPLGEIVNFSQRFVKIRLLSIEKESEVVYNNSTWFLVESCLSRAVIRTRREGDTCSRAGSSVTKELRRFMNDMKIPPRYRDRLLLVMDGGKTLWFPGFLHGEGFTDPKSREKFEEARICSGTAEEKIYKLEFFSE